MDGDGGVRHMGEANGEGIRVLLLLLLLLMLLVGDDDGDDNDDCFCAALILADKRDSIVLVLRLLRLL